MIYTSLSKLSRQQTCWSLHVSPGFNGLGEDNCKTRRETFQCWCLVRLILYVWPYIQKHMAMILILSQFVVDWYIPNYFAYIFQTYLIWIATMTDHDCLSISTASFNLTNWGYNHSQPATTIYQFIVYTVAHHNDDLPATTVSFVAISQPQPTAEVTLCCSTYRDLTERWGLLHLRCFREYINYISIKFDTLRPRQNFSCVTDDIKNLIFLHRNV